MFLELVQAEFSVTFQRVDAETDGSFMHLVECYSIWWSRMRLVWVVELFMCRTLHVLLHMPFNLDWSGTDLCAQLCSLSWQAQT